MVPTSTNCLGHMWANYTKTWLWINILVTSAKSDILETLEMLDTLVNLETEAP